MARGGYRVGAGRKPKSVKAKASTSPEKSDLQVKIELGALEAGITPLEFMLAVMRDQDQPFKNRAAMAVAAAPYVHDKTADIKLGKKDQKSADAKTAGQGTGWGDDLKVATAN